MKALKNIWAASRMKTQMLFVWMFAFLGLAALPASANDLSQIGTQIATAVGQFVAIISAIGLAGVSVVVMVTAFRMAFNFVKALK